MPFDPAEYARKKEAKDAAIREASRRDSLKGIYILQTSPRRYAIVYRQGMSWSHINHQQDPEGLNPDSWLTHFDLAFMTDGEGKELKNLTYQDSRYWYRKLMTESQ
jgi:hypothetical protein